MQQAFGFPHKGSLLCVCVCMCVCVCVFVGGVKWSKRQPLSCSAQITIIFIGVCICKLTTICLATGSASGCFSAILVHAPALSPVALQLPVEAVLIAAGDGLPLNWNVKFEGEAASQTPGNTTVLRRLPSSITLHVAAHSRAHE